MEREHVRAGRDFGDCLGETLIFQVRTLRATEL